MLGGAAGGRPRPVWPSAGPQSDPQNAEGFAARGYGAVYSLFPPGPAGQRPSGPFHKASESLFSGGIQGSAGGAPTPPPGSPYALDLNKAFQVEQQSGSKPHPHTFHAEINQVTGCCGPGPSDTAWENRPLLDPAMLQPLTIKTESALKKSCCSSAGSPVNKKFVASHSITEISSGCSRTNPITWGLPIATSGTTLQVQGVGVQVKREPGCSVGGVGDMLVPVLQPSAGVSVVKIEHGSPAAKPEPSHAATVTSLPSSLNNGSIPVGIAVARQRLPHELLALGAPPAPAKDSHAHSHTHAQRFGDIGTGGFNYTSSYASTASSHSHLNVPWQDGAAMTVGGALLHCDERSTNQVAGWGAQGPSSAMAPPATLWQYPAQVSMDGVMMGMGGALGGMGSMGAMGTVAQAPPAPSTGFQLVRDPASGALILLPAPPPAISLFPDQFQQAVVWGGLGAPMLLPPPAAAVPPLQFLGGGELLASTTLHQHTQTHSTRLVALHPDAKRGKPMSLPPHTLIKIEECTPTHGHCPKPSPQDLHLFYQTPSFMQVQPSPQAQETNHHNHPHATTNSNSVCRSQGTSPVVCLTPPPDTTQDSPGVHDASNQTDCPQEHDDEDTTDSSDAAHSDTAEKLKPFLRLSKHHLADMEMEPECSPRLDSGGAIRENNESMEAPNVKITEVNEDTIPLIETANDSKAEQSTNTDNVPDIITPDLLQDCEPHKVDLSMDVQGDILTDNNSSSVSSHDLVIDSDRLSPDSIRHAELLNKDSKLMLKVDLSGLELLSNSIEQFETRSRSMNSSPHAPGILSMPSLIDHLQPVDSEDERKTPNPILVMKTSPKFHSDVNSESCYDYKPTNAYNEERPSLGGLGLLCALAEQRFMEEVEDKQDIVNKSDSPEEPENISDKQYEKEDRHQESQFKDIWRDRDNRRDTFDKLLENPRSSVEIHYRSSSKHDRDKAKDSKERRREERRNKESISRRKSMCEKTPEQVYRKKSYDVGDKRRSSDKSHGSSASAVDEAELMESLNNTYRRITKCQCDVAHHSGHRCGARASMPTTKELVNAMEEDMRIRLAELQKQCKQKQRELSKMSPNKEETTVRRGPGRPRKKSCASDRTGSPQPAKKDSNKQAAFSFASGQSTNEEVGSLRITLNTGSDLKLFKEAESLKRPFSPITDSNSSQSSVDRSSSKKRKVGRPKKLISAPGSHAKTETIVAKKPKSKSSLVGYLLAAKSKLNMATNKGGIIYSKTNPPRPFEDESPKKLKIKKSVNMKTKERAHSSNCYSSPASSLSEYKYPVGLEIKEKYAPFISSKVRPKLKAEAKIKEFSEEEDLNNDWCVTQSNLADVRSTSSSMESLHEVRMKNKEKTDKLALKHQETNDTKLPEIAVFKESHSHVSDIEDERKPPKKRRKSMAVMKEESVGEETVPTEPEQASEPSTARAPPSRCTLTEAHLEQEGLRVLTAMGGLFYAGRLSAITAPDVYAITLDGERGNRPHILSREETLRDAIVEVTPACSAELPPGARLCAYWSQQYRCLYPGTVAEAVEPDEPRFLSVEFDDGDSGRIALEDIRLLQPDYPVVEYDANPLLTLGKRRRQTSVNSTEDKRSAITMAPLPAPAPKPAPPAPVTTSVNTAVTDKPHSDSEEKHRERKKLKKHRKDKMKRHTSGSGDDNSSADYVRKKKKKHKCCEEHCKHKKHHKKHHRKHRKHHSSASKDHTSSSGELSSNLENRSEDPDSSEDLKEEDVTIMLAVDDRSTDNMKKVIKKSVVPKKSIVKNSVLEFSKLNEKDTTTKKDEVSNKKDNLKDSGIGLDCVENASPPKNAKKGKRSVSTASLDSSSGSHSAMAAFLPGTALWRWRGTATRRRARKLFYRAIQRGKEVINVGDAAVFLSTGRADRPYIGQISSMWEGRPGTMAVKVRWFYHPEETEGCPGKLQYPGGLFESPHTDENDVQTISHKCSVVSLERYRARLHDDPARLAAVYDNNDLYYRAGHYHPTHRVLTLTPGIPVLPQSSTPNTE